jgi:hypothetical protein
MVKANYAAWHIKTNDFSDALSDIDKLKFFARFAILAPSGHNTQPWRFNFQKGKVLVSADKARHLPYSGLQANEPFVSIGTCIETFALAAKSYGYPLSVEYDLNGRTIATLALGKKENDDPALRDAILHRVSNRHPYEKAPLDKKLFAEIAKSPFNTVTTQAITSPTEIEYIAQKTIEATYRTFSDREFRSELSNWVRNNKTRQFDGMPGFAQGIPTPPSMLAKHIIKRVNISKDQAKKDSKRILESRGLIILALSENSQKALIDAGRMYASVCVLAQKNGLASAGVGTAVIDATSCIEIQKHFRLKGKPVAIIRIGKAKKPARHTPRLPLELVTD